MFARIAWASRLAVVRATAYSACASVNTGCDKHARALRTLFPHAATPLHRRVIPTVAHQRCEAEKASCSVLSRKHIRALRINDNVGVKRRVRFRGSALHRNLLRLLCALHTRMGSIDKHNINAVRAQARKNSASQRQRHQRISHGHQKNRVAAAWRNAGARK